MKAHPCRRLDPISGEVIEVLRGRSYQPSKTKFLRRHWTPAALQKARDQVADSHLKPTNGCKHFLGKTDKMQKMTEGMVPCVHKS
jgi:hypothetical protein